MPVDGAGSSEQAKLLVLGEAELASLRREEGSRVVAFRGHLWEEIQLGFYQPVNLLGSLTASEIGRPTPLCWGYRASLGGAEAGSASASIPAHVLSLPMGFDERKMIRNRRTDLRKCRQLVEFIRMDDSGPLLEQAFQVFQSAMRRVAYWHPREREEYLRRMARGTADERNFFIGGMIEGRLGGYMETFAVEGILYLKELIVATEALASGISTGLYVEAINAGLRSGEVHLVCSGLHAPENDGLCHFKRGMGFSVVQVPAVSAIPRPVRALLRARRPMVYYRLTGDLPMGNPPPGSPPRGRDAGQETS